MQIRRRYAKTIMASMRRDHLPHNVRYLSYVAFTTRMKHGRYACTYRWHFKKVELNFESLSTAIRKMMPIGSFKNE